MPAKESSCWFFHGLYTLLALFYFYFPSTKTKRETEMSALGLDYWLQWQVFVCALIFIIPTTIALRFIINKRRKENEPIIIKSTDLWIPCWRNLHPIWLLSFRASALVAMAFMIYQTVVNLGFFVFLFYTQYFFLLHFIVFYSVKFTNSQLIRYSKLFFRWTFALVGIYFAVLILQLVCLFFPPISSGLKLMIIMCSVAAGNFYIGPGMLVVYNESARRNG